MAMIKFYLSQQGKAEKGLEISTLAVVDVDYNTAYNFSTRQTLPLIKPNETRVDQYLAHLQADCVALPESVRYLVADGYYSKIKFIDGVTALNLDLIGKLRHDASEQRLYHGEQKPRGRPKLYEGKVCFDNLEGFELEDEIEGVKLYVATVNSPHFKRNVRIVYLVKVVGDQLQTAERRSTDLKLSAKDIYRFYKARFQIELE